MNDILPKVSEIVANVLEASVYQISKDTKLLGNESTIKSRELVEILLEIEDFMEDEYSVEFDWSSNSAMSDANSNYKTVQTLSDHLLTLI